MPVCCGGGLCDSGDSEWNDPSAIAGETCVEDYDFDVPEEMDLMFIATTDLRIARVFGRIGKWI